MTAAQLKASILDLAIRGLLVPQDPNDEPAEKLLARIRGGCGADFNTEAQRHRDAVDAAPSSRGRARRPATAAPLPIPEEEKPFALPAGWAWCRLGEMTETITSGSREWAKYYSDSGDIFLRMGNLSRNSFELRLDSIQHVRPPCNSEGSRTCLQPLDLLFSITAEIGLLGLIPEGFGKAYINQHTAMIRFAPVLRGRYLPYVLLSPYMRRYYDGGTHGLKSSFRLDTISTFPIPLPPLAEQKRIVAKIEELLPLVKRYEAAEQKRDKLDGEIAAKLKTSLLDQAIRGQLVAQEPNDEPAAKLLARIWDERSGRGGDFNTEAQRHGDAVDAASSPRGRGRSPSGPLPVDAASSSHGRARRPATAASTSARVSRLASHVLSPIPDEEKPFVLPAGWEWVRLGDIATIISGVSYDKCDVLLTGPVRIIRGGNLSDQSTVSIRPDDVFLPDKYKDDENTLQAGDVVVVASTGSSTVIGRAGFVDYIPDSVQIGAFLKIVRIGDLEIRPYVRRVFQTAYYSQYIRGAVKGIGIKNVKVGYLSDFPIPLPPLAEQKRIVAKIEELLPLVAKLKT